MNDDCVDLVEVMEEVNACLSSIENHPHESYPNSIIVIDHLTSHSNDKEASSPVQDIKIQDTSLWEFWRWFETFFMQSK